MSKEQPFSGRVIEAIQKRYTEIRIKTGTATEQSASEFFLKHLKKMGIRRGLPVALKEYHDAIVQQGTDDKFFHGWLDTYFILCASGIHFSLITTGIVDVSLDGVS